MHYRFPARFRLKRQRLIRPLFDRSRTDVARVRVGVVRVVYRWVDPVKVGMTVPVQVGVAVPRKLGKAVRRNRVRRMLRETYRLYHPMVIETLRKNNEALTMMILFQGPADAASRISTDLPQALHLLCQHLSSESLDTDEDKS